MQNCITKYGDENRREAMARLVAMHRLISERLGVVAKADKRYETVILSLSTLTAGSLGCPSQRRAPCLPPGYTR